MLAGKGWGLGATMHADSLPEALDSLRTSLGATDADLAGLTIYLQYAAYLTPAGMYRRVEEAWHLRLDADGAPPPPMLPGDSGRASRPFVHDPAAYAVLAESLGLTPDALEAELAERGAFL